MSVYRGQEKVLNSITAVEEEKVKEIVVTERPIKTFTDITQLGLSNGCTVEDIFLSIPDNSYFEQPIVEGKNVLNTPEDNGLLSIRKVFPRFSIEFKVSGKNSLLSNKLYIGQLTGIDGSGLTWSRVCTTSIANQTLSFTVLDSTAVGTNYSHGYIREGRMVVNLDLYLNTPTEYSEIDILQINVPDGLIPQAVNVNALSTSNKRANMRLETNGVIHLSNDTNTGAYNIRCQIIV